MQHIKRVGLSILLAVTMVVTAFAVMMPSGASAAPAAGPDEIAPLADVPSLSEFSKVAYAPPDEKIDAALRDRMSDAQGKLRVSILVVDRAAVNEQLVEMGLPEIRGMEFPDMPTPRTMELDVKQIWLLAGNPGVSRLMSPPEPTFEPGVDKAALESSGLEMAPEPIFEDYDVNVVHGAVDAWAKGFTGDGVNIAVIDTGFDMAHPDLQGQQARYPSGPYADWPIAYDDMAAAYWSYGMAGGWVSDTSEYVEDLGGYVEFDGETYDVSELKDVLGGTVKSQSGWFRMGYHTDQNLMYLFGSEIAVLVVDSTTAFVYDTVYVDIMDDSSFSNDKACTKGDEISYFDFYDADLETYDVSNWDAGDGLADLSGGMVYWISDGVNVLPGSDLWWGASWVPGSGEAVAFMGEFYYGQSHGTMTSSAALATGTTLGGQLGGMAPGAKLITIPMTNDLYGSWIFAALGADGMPGTDDDAHVVSNSYGFSDSAIIGGYTFDDAVAWYIGTWNPYTLWFWSTGNGGPGYGTVHPVTDHSSVHVGAGTTMQYRGLLGYEPYGNQKWGDVIPFSNSGPGRNGKLNAEIIASGAYSLEPMPLNQWDLFGGIGDGSMHLQIGSGTSHATPTAAGGAALGWEAYMRGVGGLPDKFEAKAWLLASADDMHYDVFKQGAGWLNASRFVEFMGNWNECTGTIDLSGPQYGIKGSSYPGTVYGTYYETFPNLMYPGDSFIVDPLETINFNPADSVDVSISAKLPLLTTSETVHLLTESADDVFVDITGLVPSSTDLVKVTMFMPFSQFDPDMDYVSDLSYWLEAHDWADLNDNDVMDVEGWDWELFRYTVDGSDSNYNQIMLKDPIERTTDGLIVRVRAIEGAAGVDITLQVDSYELQTFPWVTFMEWGGSDWSTELLWTIGPWGGLMFSAKVDVPLDAPVGSYGAGIYIESDDRLQCLPVVINVAADSYVFEFGGPSYFDTPYNNSFTGIADKGWRFEVGDWRIFWSMPLDSIPTSNSKLVASVEWTELPTDVNVHILSSWDYGDWTYEWPYGPGYGMELVAGSDEKYMGAGTFGVYTNTGGPKEVIAADFGFYYKWWGAAPEPSPFAVVTRCPVMSGSSAYENILGETAWLDINDYSPYSVDLFAPIPGDVPLEDDLPAWYDITVSEDVEAKGGGSELMTYTNFDWQPIYQDWMTGDFYYDLANAAYSYHLEVADCSMLMVYTYEIWNAPDIDLGVWYDANANGVAELSEPYWTSGTSGSYESVTLEDLEDGWYIIKVLGYTVTASPGYFGLEIYMDIPGAYSVAATGLESPVGSGTHEFSVSYNAPAVQGYYFGYASFGFMGADDMVSIPFSIEVYDDAPPAIENLYPADEEVLGTSTVVVSFWVNDRVECFSGFDQWSVQVTIDGWLTLWMTTTVEDENVSAAVPFALTEGVHTLEIWAADLEGNWAYEYTTFVVDSVIETFDAWLADPSSGDPIDSGSTVAADEVEIRGWADPHSAIDITSPHASMSLYADEDGYFEQGDVPLVEGYNVFVVVATNLGGVSKTTSLMVVSDTTCMLWVVEPVAVTADDHLELRGLTDVGAAVTVDGTSATVAADGSWVAHVVLSEGANSIEVEAEDALGNTASATVHVTLDTTPPSLEITSPEDGATVSEASVTVNGTTDAGAAVHVNGVLASDGSTSWSATVVLAEGENTVTVTATDELGNSATESITVEYVPPVYVTPDELQGIVDDLTDQIEDLMDQIDSLEDQLGQDVDDVNARVDEADDFANMLMYLTIGLFLAAIVLLVVVWFMLGRRGGGDGPSDSSHDPGPPSDLDHEFESLEKEK